MRTILRAVTAILLLVPACTIEGPPADGHPFGASNFADGQSNRSQTVDSACQSYCDAADQCGLTSEDEDCFGNCVGPKLTAASSATTSAADCSSAYEASTTCAADPVCDDFSACDDALDEFLACSLAN